MMRSVWSTAGWEDVGGGGATGFSEASDERVTPSVMCAWVSAEDGSMGQKGVRMVCTTTKLRYRG